MKQGSYLKVLLLCGLTAAIGASYFSFGYFEQLRMEVQEKFNGRKWELPAIVYARPLEIYPSLKITADLLEKELQLADYRKETPVTASGGYSRENNDFDIVTRGFHFASGFEKSVSFHLTIKNGTLTGLQGRDKGEELDFVRLDPARIGSFHPQVHEDRLVLQTAEIPELLKQGLIAVEDRDFQVHHGISPSAIIRALVANLRAGKTVQGGSTLTQQLVKNLYLDQQRTLKRKVSEALMALILDYHYSKDEIMATYINEVFLGQDGARAIHGFGLASHFYFRTDLGELSVAQLATLIGMVKGASYLNPRKYPDRCKARRDVVLRVMFDENIISKESYTRAVAEPLGGDSEQKNGFNRFPAYLDLVRFQLQKEYRKEDLQTNGLRILTNLNPQVQWLIEERMQQRIKSLEQQSGARDVQAAVVITQRETGEVLGLAGGVDGDAGSFNRALDASRPIGSLVKPAVFLTALQEGYTLASPVLDSVEGMKNGDSDWAPQNYDKKEHGVVPLYTALAKSYNLATVRLGMEVGLEKVIETIQNLGYPEPVASYPSLLLGAVEMSPLQVSQMYQTIASGGFYQPLRSIQSVSTQDGELVTRYGLEIEQRFPSAVMELLNHGLSRVVSEGTAKSYPFDPGSFFAGKTGTTDGLRDSWFAGFSNSFSAVVWMGKDDNSPTPFTGSSGALKLWGDIMQKLEVDPSSPQPLSSDVVWLKVAIQNRSTSEQQGAVSTVLPFIRGTEPRPAVRHTSPSGLQTIEHKARGIFDSINRIFK